MTIENQFHPDIAFHPGEVLREKLQEIGMTSNEFAERTKMPERTINAVIKGTSSITPDMAVFFERVTKIPAYFWLDMQQSYDEFIAHKERKSAIIDSANWAKKFPVSEMVNKGWFAPGKTCAEKTKYNAFNDLKYITLSLNKTIATRIKKTFTREQLNSLSM